MVNESVICPACGSGKVSRSETECTDKLTLGSEFTFKTINYKCNSCGEEGDFLAESDENYLAAQKEAQVHLVKQILGNLHQVGISMALFERVFELPARTLTRWKNGDFSSTSVALLRLVSTCPWIIEVAEYKFDPTSARNILIKVAAQEFTKVASVASSKHFETKTGNLPTTVFVATSNMQNKGRKK